MPTPESVPTTSVTEAPPAHDSPEQQRYKTITVRVEERLHAQLQFISNLSGTTISDEIRTAIEGRITAAQEDPDLQARALAAQQEIEREAAARTAAIAGFIGHTAAAAPTGKTTRGTGRSTRTPKPAGS